MVNGYLLDTNIVSELRRRNPDPGVTAWYDATDAGDLHLSAISVGEIRRGIERLRPRDGTQAGALDRWLEGLKQHFADRIQPVDLVVAERWGRLGVRQPISVADGLIAATSLAHELTLVTRNVADFEPHGVAVLNPFAG
ncbi:MAG: type II toxin-antitoxin system VapC family toxin [Akkermansiaceae bacterium]|nr:type II toxin-antitoxin system VapC family toxin [Akkermansiaceae bacterium]NNM28695.1 type II toxin-antitoxin system VapC family toxin [Akkermansiaceae bacterium]